MPDFVSVSRPDDAVAWLTFDRSAKRNALSIRVRDEMSDALDALAGDESVRVVVIASTGPVFSAGFDLREFEDESVQEALWASSDRWHGRLRSFPLPLIASVQGPALAGGFDLATMCDLRVVARSATFARPERLFSPTIYSIVRDLAGGAVAREMAFTNRTLTAEEALSLRLVTRVVDGGDLRDATMSLAREVAAAPRDALVRSKAMAIAAAKVAERGSFGW
ncbi:MAG TPA: enoyl-CoA hydratase/isomerase family protein [Acidimicrobiales bacterium]